MREPQEIEDEEHEQLLERVAAIDVAKASGEVCTRVPHPARPGRRLTKVWDVDATTGAIIELAEQLVGRIWLRSQANGPCAEGRQPHRGARHSRKVQQACPASRGKLALLG